MYLYTIIGNAGHIKAVSTISDLTESTYKTALIRLADTVLNRIKWWTLFHIVTINVSLIYSIQFIISFYFIFIICIKILVTAIGIETYQWACLSVCWSVGWLVVVFFIRSVSQSAGW